MAIRVGTLSKALGCSGGFVAGCRPLIDWLINRARPYIFSTASPPANSAAAVAALDIVENEPLSRTALLETARALATRLRSQGWNLGDSNSQILPIVIGSSEHCLAISAQLRDQGLWVPAIRPPSVRPGEACLRISLSAGHTPAMIDRLVSSLAAIRTANSSITQQACD